jgi:hypothetical protein
MIQYRFIFFQKREISASMDAYNHLFQAVGSNNKLALIFGTSCHLNYSTAHHTIPQQCPMATLHTSTTVSFRTCTTYCAYYIVRTVPTSHVGGVTGTRTEQVSSQLYQIKHRMVY